MARTGELPHRPYYGTVDATPLWLVLLGGDVRLDRRPRPRRPAVAERAARARLDRHATATATATGSSSTSGGHRRGLVNQGWKDSGDGIRDRKGQLAPTPIALAEVQGYVFDAKRRMAALARVRGEEDLARPPRGGGRDPAPPVRGGVLVRGPVVLRDGARRREAAGGRDRVQRRPLPVDRDRLAGAGPARRRPADGARHVQRLGHPDVRRRPRRGYNPIGYHTGTVWPHDVSLIAAGFKRYGFHDEANRLVGRIFEASQHFADFRLPELFCGFDRDIRRSPSRTRSPARRRPGRRARCSCSSRRCWACARTPTAASWSSSGPSCPTGCRRSRSPNLRVGDACRRPPVPSLARRHVRGGPAQEPATSTSPSGCSAVADAAPTVAELVARRHGAARRLRLRLARAWTRSCCWARRSASTGPASSRTATRPSGADARQAFEAAVARRERGEPVAYIRGFREFHGLAFATDARALIPRPETELLVDAALGRDRRPAHRARRAPAARRRCGSPTSGRGPARSPSRSWRRCAGGRWTTRCS